MRASLRDVLAIVAGFVVASVVMMAVEGINGHVLYPDLGRAAAGVTDRRVIEGILATAPTGALLVVALGWALGSVGGGCVAAWIARSSATRSALILGVLLTLAGVASNLMLPPPPWFWFLGLAVFIPSALVGARMAPRRAEQR